MKAVFLDYATMGPNLDLWPMRRLLPDLEIFDSTDDESSRELLQEMDDFRGRTPWVDDLTLLTLYREEREKN